MKENEAKKSSKWKQVGENLRRYLPTGVYYLRATVGSKIVVKSLQTTDKAEAISARDTLLTKLRKEYAAGVNEVCTFNKLLQLALTDLDRRERLGKGKNDGLSQGSAQCYRWCEVRVRKYVDKEALQTPVREITTTDLEDWLPSGRRSVLDHGYFRGNPRGSALAPHIPVLP